MEALWGGSTGNILGGSGLAPDRSAEFNYNSVAYNPGNPVVSGFPTEVMEGFETFQAVERIEPITQAEPLKPLGPTQPYSKSEMLREAQPGNQVKPENQVKPGNQDKPENQLTPKEQVEPSPKIGPAMGQSINQAPASQETSAEILERTIPQACQSAIDQNCGNLDRNPESSAQNPGPEVEPPKPPETIRWAGFPKKNVAKKNGN
ncbi:MAG TPA: hypothetical protein VHY08_23150 [Bacillota bacterium]|nr:hypothetical protein [Bacillota bacterium]